MPTNTCCRRARLRAGTAVAAIAGLCVIPLPAEAIPQPVSARHRGAVVPDRLDPITVLAAQSSTPAVVVALPPPDPRQVAIDRVIQEALAQLGKPYRWGGSGPDVFDCSGFTAWAWRAAGVELAHYTGAQFAETIQVGIDELLPGDLVFHGMGHVALYLGDGQIVHAPNSGSVVRIDAVDVWGSPTVASRPEPVVA